MTTEIGPHNCGIAMARAARLALDHSFDDVEEILDAVGACSHRPRCRSKGCNEVFCERLVRDMARLIERNPELRTVPLSSAAA